MAYFNIKERKFEPRPIPPIPPYVPPTPPTPPTPEEGDTPIIPRPSFTGDVNVTVYVNTSDSNVLHKNINAIASYNCVLKEDTNIVNPEIILESNIDLTNINYMKIGSYYYYANVTYLKGGLYRINGVMDGLMSADFSACRGSLQRSASNYNRYINGDTPVASYEQVKTLEFTNGFNKNLNYLLVTIGG